MPNEQITFIEKLLPGTIGSMGAMLWMQGPWFRKLALVILGIAASHFFSPAVNAYTALALPPDGLGEGTAGFMVGLFSMSIVDGVFRLGESIFPHVPQLTIEFVRKILRLPSKD